MAILITLRLPTGCMYIGSIFITGIFWNYFTPSRGIFFIFRARIPGDPRPYRVRQTNCTHWLVTWQKIGSVDHEL